MQSLVLGATGIVGGLIIQRLAQRGEKPLALSRRSQAGSEKITWLLGDLSDPTNLVIPEVDVIFSTVHPRLLARALDHISPPKRIVCFTSTSILTKLESEIEGERGAVRNLAEGEQELRACCDRLEIAWTILRPTMIYAEGRDANISRIASFVRRFRFFPLAGLGSGLRQPVHAEDLALGAVAAASTQQTVNRIYILAGGETLTYREMVGRIFDALELPRLIVPVPPPLWKYSFAVFQRFFPRANYAMGLRMSRDMAFDNTPAFEDFGWQPRVFAPDFSQ
jgi:uncharacterized protein YbjT (DUF2867 family)